MKIYILDVSPADVVLIGRALDLLPYGEVWKLVASLQQQIVRQEKPQPVVVEPLAQEG